MVLVCPDCFGNSGLARRIIEVRPDYPDAQCDFHPRKKGVPASVVAGIIDDVFRNRYTPGGSDYIYDEYGHGSSDLIETLLDLTEADDDRVANALADALIDADNYWPPDGEEPFYDREYSYKSNEYGYDEHSLTWRWFRNGILHEQRFFNSDALKKLNDIFDGLHLIRNESNDPAVYELKPDGPNSVFYRARISNNPAARAEIIDDPATNLGPPPEQLRTAGRMNSSGIMTYYGAFDLQTCIAELRPAVGEKIATAQFTLARPILVLDTTGFTGRPKAINIFAKTHIKRMRLWKFMTQFMNEIAQPCLPSDEHLDYVPTQVVSEYLTHLHEVPGAYEGKRIDGIIYRSAQRANGKNIAIFRDSAMVEGAKNDGFRWPRAGCGLKVVEDTAQSLVVGSVVHETAETQTPPLAAKIEQDDEFPF